MESFVYKKLGKGQKYAYYPLLFTEDAQIRVKYPEGYNQYEIARNICKNLPSDYKLIIKEHPVFIGQYSTKELYDLSKFPNIVIVNPKMSSKKIFEYADYIITINSTVGYEALFFDKIVFTIGTPFYNNFPGVVHINSLSDISKFMNDARKIKEKKAEIKNKLKGSVISLLQSTLKMDYSAFLSGKNIKDGVRNIVFLMEKGVG